MTVTGIPHKDGRCSAIVLPSMPQALILLNRGRETRVCADGWQSFGVRLDFELPATADSECSGGA